MTRKISAALRGDSQARLGFGCWVFIGWAGALGALLEDTDFLVFFCGLRRMVLYVLFIH